MRAFLSRGTVPGHFVSAVVLVLVAVLVMFLRFCLAYCLSLLHRVPFRRWSGAGGLGLAVLLTGCGSMPGLPSLHAPAHAVSHGSASASMHPRLAVALGGGAARGFAHVGALEVLDEAGIHPDMVVGTSAGSVVAALYAIGIRGRHLEDAAQSLDQNAITDWMLPFFNRGLLRGSALERFINQKVGQRPIQSMPLPLGIVATDLQTGDGILFRSGNTGQAVRASSSVPGVFEPVRIGSRDYVDGGLVAPVPVNYARQMGADIVVAIDISSLPRSAATHGQLDILLQTFTIMGQSINRYELKQADVVLRPALGGMSSVDLNNRSRAIAAGRAAMQHALPRIRALLARVR